MPPGVTWRDMVLQDNIKIHNIKFNLEYTSEHAAKVPVKGEEIRSVGFDVRTIDGLDYQIRIWI